MKIKHLCFLGLIGITLLLFVGQGKGQGAGLPWQVQTVDGGGDVGTYSSITLDGQGNPHIAYRDSSSSDLKYARGTPAVDGSFTWVKERIESGGIETEIALSPTRLYLVHTAGVDDLELRFLSRDSAGTLSSALIDDFSIVTPAQVIFDSARDRIHVSYRNRGEDDCTGLAGLTVDERLIHRWQNADGSGATCTRITSGSIGTGRYDMSLGSDGILHATYTHFSSGTTYLKYRKSSAPAAGAYTWGGAETVWSRGGLVGGAESTRHALALDSHNNPHIVFYDPGSGALRYKGWVTIGSITAWTDVELVDGTDDAGDEWAGHIPDLVVGPGDILHVLYTNSRFELKYARKQVAESSSQWRIFNMGGATPVYSGGASGTALAVSGNGTLHGSFYEPNEFELRYLRLPACGNQICGDPGETAATCPGDCQTICGDGFCDAGRGETYGNCAADCPCTANDQCPGLQACVAGACQDCDDDSQCESGRICQDGGCVLAPVVNNCTANADCPGGSVCQAGTCVSCLNDAQCDAGLECNRGACVEPPAPPVCGNNTCEAGETSESCPADCPPPPLPITSPPPPAEAGGRGFCTLIR